MFSFRTQQLLIVAAMGLMAACGPASGSEAASTLVVHLTVAEDVDIDEVHWKISGGDMEDMMGTIDTSAPGSTASIELFGVPAGSGYLVEMEALTTDGDYFCKGGASFDVVTGIATPLDITLSCARECRVLFCADPEGDCRLIPLPDGASCADGAGSCVGGSCQISGA